MAAKWQQWIPFHIDRFMASLTVQAMHPAARWGYWCLITRQWQSEDCSISADPLDLAELSGLGDQLWAEHGSRIVRKFAPLEDGRLRNPVCYDEWLEAKRVYDKRREAADRTNKMRPEPSGLEGETYRENARKTISSMVRRGDLPKADSVNCVDCGHIGTGRVHDWDHYKGYDPQHFTDVEAVCRPCHVKREESRGKRWIIGDRDGDRDGKTSEASRFAYTRTGQYRTGQDNTKQGQDRTLPLVGGNRTSDFSSLGSIFKTLPIPSGPLPQDKSSAIAAGYEFINSRACGVCGLDTEWWRSPAGKQVPFLADGGELHLGGCALVAKGAK